MSQESITNLIKPDMAPEIVDDFLKYLEIGALEKGVHFMDHCYELIETYNDHAEAIGEAIDDFEHAEKLIPHNEWVKAVFQEVMKSENGFISLEQRQLVANEMLRMITLIPAPEEV